VLGFTLVLVKTFFGLTRLSSRAWTLTRTDELDSDGVDTYDAKDLVMNAEAKIVALNNYFPLGLTAVMIKAIGLLLLLVGLAQL
jgi:hypothetical protein